MQLELDNILSGFRHAYNNQRTQVACDLYFAANEILNIRGPIHLASEIAARVLKLPGVQQKEATTVFLNQGKTLRLLGKNDSAKRAYESALDLARDSRNRPAEAKRTQSGRPLEVSSARQHFHRHLERLGRHNRRKVHVQPREDDIEFIVNTS